MRSLMRLPAPVHIVVLAIALPATSAAQPRYDQLRVIAPAAPGGGWDQTARAMQQALQREGIARLAPVENVPGAAGTIGLAHFMGAERGSTEVVMVSGLIMLGGIVTNRSPVTLADVVPIARLTGEYEVIAVPTASPLRSLQDLLSAFKARPESISWGGGSAGGSDQILAGLVADAVGVDPRRINYIAFAGGGESLSAILGGQVSVGINGLAEFAPQLEAGTLRALAISSAERLPGLAVPTLREGGVDVEFENWRSVVAPPGISPMARRRLEETIELMARSATWHELLDRFRWLDRYLAGENFARFVSEEEVRVRDILKKLGTGGDEGRALVSVGLYPWFVLSGLVVCGLGAGASIFLARPSSPSRTDATAGRGGGSLALIALGAVLYLGLAEPAGFVVASAGLFWLTARAFDDRRPWRDLLFAIGLSVSAYLLFARVLQLSLPAGILAGWL